MMDSSDGTSLISEQFALKKNNLRKAILLVALETKGLDEHFDSAKKCFSECENHLITKSKNLESRMKDLDFREEEFHRLQQTQLEEFKMKEGQLAEIRKQIADKMEEVVLKVERLGELTKATKVLRENFQVEKQEFEYIKKSVGENLNAIRLEKKKIEDRSKELNMVQDWIKRRAKEIDSREEKVEMREKELNAWQIANEDRCQELDMRARELHSERKYIKKMSEKLVSKENQLDSVQKYIRTSFYDFHARSRQLKIVEELLEKQLEDQSKAFESVTKQLENKFNGFELKKIQIEEGWNDLESKLKELSEELIFKEKQLEVRSKDLVFKETQLEEQTKCSKSKEREYEKLFKDFEMKQKLLEERAIFSDLMNAKLKERSEELVLKDKQLEQIKESGSKENGLRNVFKENVLERNHCDGEVHSHFGVEQAHDVPVMDSNAEFHVLSTLDSLQLNMTEDFKNYDSLSDKVCKILQSSLDPSNLVLGVIDGFYPSKCPHMAKGDMEFKMNVVRRNCMIFLEQLMELSPQIHPHVKKRALGLAGKWKVNLEVDPKCPLEVLAYIQLVASFKLASNYDADEILQLLEFVPICKEVPKILRSLSLQEKASDFTERLIRNNQHLKAVKCIAACGLVDMFPPVPLLKDYMDISKKTGKFRCLKKDISSEAKDREIDDRVACVKAVIRCIIDNKIECGNWCSDLKKYTERLQKRKGQERTKLPDLDVSDPPNDSEERKHVPYVEGGYFTKLKANAVKLELKAPEAVISCSEQPKLETQYPPNKIRACSEQVKKEKLARTSFGSASASNAQPERRDDMQKKRKGFGVERSGKEKVNHLRPVKLPRPTILPILPKFALTPFASSVPLLHFPPFLIPQENSDLLVGSTFGQEHDFGYLPNYHVRPGPPSRMHCWPPARDQRHNR